ncbi:MAG: hypothetical protein WCF93_01220 [Candidatus Moraniibacteriota bacterium]
MEKFKFDFSKQEDHEKFSKLELEDRYKLKEEAHEDANVVRAFALDSREDKELASEPTPEEYLLANANIENAKSGNDSEKLDQLCEVVARQHEFNLVNWKKPMAVRVAFSGFMDETIENGFQEKSFIYDRALSYFDFGDMVNWTRNDAFSRGCEEAMWDAFNGKLAGFSRSVSRFMKDENGKEYKNEQSAIEAYKILIKKDFPEIYEVFCQQEEKLRREYDEDDSHEKWKEYDKLFVNLDSFEGMLGDINESDVVLKKQILSNLITKKKSEGWSFEEIDYFYNRFVDYYGKNIVKNFYGGQLYDMAYVVDPAKIDKSGKGYLPGYESVVTSSADCVEGYVINGAPLNLGNYFIEKAKRIFRKHPELSRPLYDTRGNLVWPDSKTSKELDIEFPKR